MHTHTHTHTYTILLLSLAENVESFRFMPYPCRVIFHSLFSLWGFWINTAVISISREYCINHISLEVKENRVHIVVPTLPGWPKSNHLNPHPQWLTIHQFGRILGIRQNNYEIYEIQKYLQCYMNTKFLPLLVKLAFVVWFLVYKILYTYII